MVWNALLLFSWIVQIRMDVSDSQPLASSSWHNLKKNTYTNFIDKEVFHPLRKPSLTKTHPNVLNLLHYLQIVSASSTLLVSSDICWEKAHDNLWHYVIKHYVYQVLLKRKRYCQRVCCKVRRLKSLRNPLQSSQFLTNKYFMWHEGLKIERVHSY